jgi:glutamine cyclotransferase
MRLPRATHAVLAMLALGILAAVVALASRSPERRTQPTGVSARVGGITVVREYPHDPQAFTQGLIYSDGFLYESTGPAGRSSIRKVELETGNVIHKRDLDDRYFGEGLTEWRGRLVQLTPMRTVTTAPSSLTQIGKPSFLVTALARRFGVNIGATYDMTSFGQLQTFTFKGEGWGLTRDDRRLIMSDGTPELRFLDPETFDETGRLTVTDGGRPVNYLNELEFIRDAIYANVWFEKRIAVISPDTGIVRQWIDLSSLDPDITAASNEAAAGAVLNGIAYDAATGRLFVTGKLWSWVYEILLR